MGPHLKVFGRFWGVHAEAGFYGLPPHDIIEAGIYVKVFDCFWAEHAEAAFFGLIPYDVTDAGLYLKVFGSAPPLPLYSHAPSTVLKKV